MTDMQWLRDIEEADLLVTSGGPCPCPHCRSTRRLAAAVRLAGHICKAAEVLADTILACPHSSARDFMLGQALQTMVWLKGAVAQLRSGDVEEKL